MQLKQGLLTALGIISLTAITSLTAPGISRATALLYKSYVVRPDRGRDILCDPYIVQRDDYVLKIFKQRGEIAHADFPEFLNIFRRINPQIPNINRIRPGQHIFIPLKKLAPGSLPNQDTGIVTIPFVTISTLPELLKANSSQYTVKRGDTVSRILSRSFGRYGTRAYREGVRIFQAINPEIADLNQIYTGQTLMLPQASLRNQSWYTSLFDEAGNLSDQPVPTTDNRPTAPPPSPAQHRSSLEKMAALLDARLLNKGTYYFPRPGAGDFQLHLARYPILELPDRSRALIVPPSSRGTGIRESDLAAIRSFWSPLSVISVDPNAGVEQILETYFNASGRLVANNAPVAFSDNGVQVAVKARWWLNRSAGEVNPSPNKKVGLIPSTGTDRVISDRLRAYLAKHGIFLKEIQEAPHSQPAHAPRLVVDLEAAPPKLFIAALAGTMGLSYAPDIPISFPYGGIQVPAVSNLISTRGGYSMLVDFGDLYGEAVNAIKSSGLNVIQIDINDSHRKIIEKMLEGMGWSYEINPTFATSRDSGEYGVSVSIPGFLILKNDTPEKLLAMAKLDPALIGFLNAKGIEIIRIKSKTENI